MNECSIESTNEYSKVFKFLYQNKSSKLGVRTDIEDIRFNALINTRFVELIIDTR